MTTTAEKIAALETALGSGVLTIESDGERLTYRSREDLMGAITYFRGVQASEAAPGGVPRTPSTVAVYDPS